MSSNESPQTLGEFSQKTTIVELENSSVTRLLGQSYIDKK